MARPATSPAARLQRLEASLAKAKKLKRGTKLTAKPMSELLGVSWPTLLGWCDDIADFEDKRFTRGGNGIEWEFKPIPTIRFLIKHFTTLRDRQIAAAKTVRQAIGGDALADVPEDMTLDQISKMVRVGRDLREEQVRQGQLVKAAIIEAALSAMIARMQQAGLNAAREQDPTGQWEPEIAESFEHAVNNVILEIGQAGEDCLNEIRGKSAQPGGA